MGHDLRFEKLIRYDTGLAGIAVQVEMRVGSRIAKCDAKLDTGATFCLFERRIGESLGIDIESGNSKVIATVNSRFRVFGHYVTLNTEGFEFDSEVFFAEDADIRRNVLGRRGWLDQVIIGINDYDGKLYVSRYNA